MEVSPLGVILVLSSVFFKLRQGPDPENVEWCMLVTQQDPYNVGPQFTDHDFDFLRRRDESWAESRGAQASQKL